MLEADAPSIQRWSPTASKTWPTSGHGTPVWSAYKEVVAELHLEKNQRITALITNGYPNQKLAAWLKYQSIVNFIAYRTAAH